MYRPARSYKLSDNVLEEEPQKVLLIALGNRERLRRFQRNNLAWERGKCNSFFSCVEYLEYCPVGTGKGTGVLDLLQILNMPADATVAVGDDSL